MTPCQARRLLKSIVYRQKLVDDLPKLESQLSAYAHSTGTRYLAGYEISLDQGELRLDKLESLDWKQLKLHLEDSQ